MNTSTRRTSFDRILFDMNTQCDFLLPKGALPVANRAKILPNIRKIMNWGRIEGVPIISSLESHRPGESKNGLPGYCVDRSKGQKKLPFTLMPRRIVLCGDNTTDVPFDPFRRYQQVIFTKRDCDCLSNPKADRLVNSIRARCLVVFGVLAEQCIKVTVLGLLARRRQVIVVRDACGHWYATEAELAFRQMEAKRAIVATTDELLSGKAEARIDENRKPLVEDEPAPDACGKGSGREADRAGTGHHDRARAGDNGRNRSSRCGKPSPEASEPVDIPRRNVRSPTVGRTKLPHDFA